MQDQNTSEESNKQEIPASEPNHNRQFPIVVWLKQFPWFAPFYAWVFLNVYLTFRTWDDWVGTLGSYLLFALGIPLWFLAMKGFRRGKKIMAPTAAELRAIDQRPPILYLRSFKDELITARMARIGWGQWDTNTEEQHIVAAFSDLGPVIAIGRPEEELPELGAGRMYVGADWQSTVTNLMTNAQLVVIRAGRTNGLLWEVQTAIQLVKPIRLLFITPRDTSEYEIFRQSVKDYLPRPLPDFINPQSRSGSLGGVLYFEADWRPHLLGIQSYIFRESARKKVIATRLKMTLRPVFDQLGQKWQPEPISIGCIIGIIFGIFVVVGFLLFVLQILVAFFAIK